MSPCSSAGVGHSVLGIETSSQAGAAGQGGVVVVEHEIVNVAAPSEGWLVQVRAAGDAEQVLNCSYAHHVVAATFCPSTVQWLELALMNRRN
jgi:hypothetical protein